MAVTTVVLAFDIVGIVIGLISIFLILDLKNKIGGNVGKALNLFMLGIIGMILAFLWTVVFARLKLLPAPAIDVHHLIMSLAMVAFVFSAVNFARIAQ
jgi:tryptophan-rich sensory protein